MALSDFSSFNNTRLVRLLSDASDRDITTSQAHFAEKFGQMLHFSSAITLSSALEEASGTDFTPSEMPENEIKNAFFSAQADLVRYIAADFIPSARRIGDQLPTAESLQAHCELTGVFSANSKRKAKKHAMVYEPYRKFYMNRQRDLDIKIQLLRSDIRDAISSLSPMLAKLAEIDQALFESISDASGEIYSIIPNFLEKRFSHLFNTHKAKFPKNPEKTDFEQWTKPGGWISFFCIEMRELLLAELEIRLQPVVGMIGALPQPPTPMEKK